MTFLNVILNLSENENFSLDFLNLSKEEMNEFRNLLNQDNHPRQS